MKKINWIYATLLTTPLVFIIYYILNLNLSDDRSIGIVGVLIIFSFNQFFFLRRTHLFTLKTILWFYIFGILSSLFFSYFFNDEPDLLSFLVLFQVYFFYKIIVKTSILTEKGEEHSKLIEEEIKNRKWYQKIWATKTQKIQNKHFIIDFFIFAAFIIIVLVIKDKLFY